MSSPAYVTFHDGKLQVPEELQREVQLEEGAKLQLVAGPGSRLLLVPARETRTGVEDWSVYRGCLADLKLDLYADLEAERVRENELDAR